MAIKTGTTPSEPHEYEGRQAPAKTSVLRGGTRMTGWHFHRIRKFTAAVVIALAALMAFTACGTSSTQTGNTSPIVIGASLSTSGDFADDGKAFQQGYELWADQVNKNGGLLGRKVKLDIVADNSTPEQVTTNYTKLITVDHV